MTQQHPITPPPELVQEWWESTIPNQSTSVKTQLCAKAAQWGADQELEACLANIHTMYGKGEADWLRSMRRPKPPTLKEQALEALGPEPLPETGPTGDTILNKGSIEHHRTIRRALEALDG